MIKDRTGGGREPGAVQTPGEPDQTWPPISSIEDPLVGHCDPLVMKREVLCPHSKGGTEKRAKDAEDCHNRERKRAGFSLPVSKGLL